MILGTALVTLVYALANVAYVRLLPVAAIVASPHVASDAASVAIGPLGASLVSAAIAVSAFGTAGIYMMTAPRLYWGMAERGLFFRSVARLHPRWRTPVRAILLQTAWAIVLILAWGTFEGLVSYVLFVDWLFFGLTAAAVFVLRRRQGPPPAYRVPGYPLVPAVFVGASVWFVASTLVARPLQALAGAALLALGLPVYASWSRHRA
jgi:APA family basic amino acid/polyamine antiporter